MRGTLQPVSRIRPGDRLAVRDADNVEGRVLRVDRDRVLVDWGGRLGT
jgi:FKBP-type peptidyl-prolyl cis-trans isomerase 2